MRRALIVHPASRRGAVTRIEARLARPGGAALAVTWRVYGSVTSLRLPETAASERGDDLWRRTCFEAFILGRESAGYVEFNVSPSSQWAAYGFSGYRDGMSPLAGIAAPRVETARTPRVFELRAILDLAGAKPPAAPPPWRVGLSAVIEDGEGVLSYWALCHPSDRPDFHHAESFALEI